MKLKFAFTKDSVRSLFWMLGEHAFVFILALLGVGVLISALLLYAYVLPAQMNIPAAPGSALKFRKDVFGQVVEIWKTQNQKFQDAHTLAPPSIFRYNSSASP